MTLDQFVHLLEIFGADFRRWPAALRAGAEALRDRSPAARAQWQAASRLDALFALDRARIPDPARYRSITDVALRRLRSLPARGFEWRLLFTRPIGAALAATLLAGWLVGAILGPSLDPGAAPGVPIVTALLEFGAGGIEGML